MPLPCVTVKSSGFFQGLTADVKLASHKCRAFFDSGASVNIIKSHVFEKLSAASKHKIQSYPPDITVSGISGKIVMPHRKVLLSVCLSPFEPPISDFFYVMDDVCFAAEILIGYHTMSHFNISLFPSIHQITQNGTFISASPFPESPPSPVVYVLTHTPSQDSSHVPPSSLETPSVTSAPVLSSTPCRLA